MVQEPSSSEQDPELKAALAVIESQKAQLRFLMETYSNQIHWAAEWRIQCHDNIRLRAILKSKEEGTEVMDLKRILVDKTAELASFRAAYHQRGILLSNALHEIQLMTAELRRLRGAGP